MGKFVGFIVGLVVFAKTKNIWIAGLSGAVAWGITDALRGSLVNSKAQSENVTESNEE